MQDNYIINDYRGNSFMDELTKTQFKLMLTKEEMKRAGFKYDYRLDEYIYRFATYKYKKNPLVYCKLGIDVKTNIVWFNVYNTDDTLYASYDNREYGNNSLIHQIDKVILNELKKIGAEKIK